MTPSELTRIAAKRSQDRSRALENLQDERRRLSEAEKELASAEEARAILQAVAQRSQELAHSRLAGVVTNALQAVFGESYQFFIEFERKRGSTEAKLTFIKDGHEVDSRGLGGGVIDVASFALRVAALVMAKPTLRRLIVADEPFKHVSREYRPAVRELVEKLAEQAGIQFVIVTHDENFRVGNVVEVK